MKAMERARVAWDARFRQRVTAFGLAYIAATVLVGVAAFVSANNLLFLLLAAMFATFLMAGFVGRLSLAGLELDLLLPQHASARRTVRAAVRLKNLKSVVPSFSVHLAYSRDPSGSSRSALYFPMVPGGASIEEPVELYFPSRGAHSLRIFEFSTRFPFGFVERRENVTIRHEVIVYPCLDSQPGFEALLTSVSDELSAMERGQGSEFYRIRPYQTTDSARSVDWKATAHTGALQVREHSREQAGSIVICLDLDVPAGASEWFERAVECAAFLAFELAERNVRLRLFAQTWDIATADIYTILKYLALVSPQKGSLELVPDDNDFLIIFTQNSERFRHIEERCRPSQRVWLAGKDFF
jgi:uncharacterized protein (DUF58 family)